MTAVKGGLCGKGEGTKQYTFVVAEQPQRRLGNIVTKVGITGLEPGGCLGRRRDHLVQYMVFRPRC